MPRPCEPPPGAASRVDACTSRGVALLLHPARCLPGVAGATSPHSNQPCPTHPPALASHRLSNCACYIARLRPLVGHICQQATTSEPESRRTSRTPPVTAFLSSYPAVVATHVDAIQLPMRTYTLPACPHPSPFRCAFHPCVSQCFLASACSSFPVAPTRLGNAPPRYPACTHCPAAGMPPSATLTFLQPPSPRWPPCPRLLCLACACLVCSPP